jgi:coproporphyrinogen III oxidase-like Fe-S oxidoreductase
VNHVPEKMFYMVIRKLELQRDINLMEIEQLFNKPVDESGINERLERIISRTKLALDSEQSIDFLRKYFTEGSDNNE